jgi:hypothetical protein
MLTDLQGQIERISYTNDENGYTIANVICHYLSEGKRVLMTSMKDPALAVLG